LSLKIPLAKDESGKRYTKKLRKTTAREHVEDMCKLLNGHQQVRALDGDMQNFNPI
jgi:hypothetical protein